MTGGSLYTGRAAGLDLAAEAAGINVKWQVEKDKKAHKYLNKNFPHIKNKYYDANECGKHNLQPVDIIFGGFPCQPFSKAGKRKGQADDRYQWPTFKRIIGELKPAWVVAENVDGITSIYEPVGSLYMEDQTSYTQEVYSILQIIKRDFEELGYAADFYIIPASSIGALHRRYRLFIVAYSMRNHAKKSMVKGQQASIGKQFMFNGEKRKIADVGDTNSKNIGRECREIQSTTKKIEGAPRCKDRKRVRGEFTDTGKDVPNTNGRGYKEPEALEQIQSEQYRAIFSGNYWDVEPQVDRVVNGFPGRVAELEGLGLAVVPQVAYQFFKPIYDIFHANRL